MSKTRRGGLRPSPAMIVAVVALVAALAGTAVAANPTATSSAINKKKVKKIATKQINELAPDLSVASADKADTATTATTADRAKIASNVFSANVQANGAMLGSQPSGATSTKRNTGDYSVSFGRSVAGCTISASLANNTGPQIGMVAVGVLNNNSLHVFTRSGANVVEDRPFYVQMICPAG